MYSRILQKKEFFYIRWYIFGDYENSRTYYYAITKSKKCENYLYANNTQDRDAFWSALLL